MRNVGSVKKMLKLPIDQTSVNFNDPQKLNVIHERVDRIEARGVGFSELQSYWSLPFHDFSVVGDVCTVKDKHNRPNYDSIHVLSSNPVWLYTMKASSKPKLRLL